MTKATQRPRSILGSVRRSVFRIAWLAYCSLSVLVQLTAEERSVDGKPNQEQQGQEKRDQENFQPLSFEKDIRPILKAACFQCHVEEEKPHAGLDTRLVRLLRQGGESGPAIQPGDPENSLLWQRISKDEMPEGTKKLPREQKEKIFAWIAQGASTLRPEPDRPEEARFSEEELTFWAFQPVKPTQPPTQASVPSEVDAFVVAKLKENGLALSPLADRRALIRRATFDLIGLPPTPSEVDAFVSDESQSAFEKVIDRLLASPQYGVRWGRHWLDVAGYSETEGDPGADTERPHAWRYRDYVIDSFSADKPYNEFVVEQLAGDQLIAGDIQPQNPRHRELLTATGFLRMAPDFTQTSNSLQDRNQAVADSLKVVSSAVLGLTIGCAQCHDHRYDPISTEDYYKWRAIFDPMAPLHAWKQPSQRMIDVTDSETASAANEIEQQAQAMETEIRSRQQEKGAEIFEREINKAPEEVRQALRDAIAMSDAMKTEEQKALLDKYPTVKPIPQIIGILIEYDMPSYRKFEEEFKKVTALRARKPPSQMIMMVQEPTDVAPASHVFFRGDPEQPRQAVEPSELFVVARAAAPATQFTSVEGQSTALPKQKRRLAYAKQITSGEHPLTARVLVNRVWTHHFGRGLVATPGDFGIFGERPTHPALLDWLARDFVENGWQIKRLHKRIMLSDVYQQSSRRTQELDQLDPENRWLGRASLRRLDAESIRDALLVSAGNLNASLGGPSILVAEDGEGKAVVGKRLLRDGLYSGLESAGAQEFRRSVYLQSRRALPFNMLDTFDLPAMNPNCDLRRLSTVASQSLWFLNDESMARVSEQMAESVQTAISGDLRDQVREVFRRLFSCEPTEKELEDAIQFVDEQREIARADHDEEWQKRISVNPEAPNQRALAAFCQTLMASSRFLYVD